MSLVCDADRLLAALEPVHPVDPAAVDRLVAYSTVLDRWASTQRLVGWRTAEKLLTEGISDAWSALPLIAGGDAPLVDLGSGAGLPALVLAAALPDRVFHLVEARRKRVSFLRDAVRVMGVSAVVVHHGRAEELRDAGAFDPEGALITSRAFARPLDVLELAARWGAAECLLTSSAARLPSADPEGWTSGSRCSSRPLADSFHVLYGRDAQRM